MVHHYLARLDPDGPEPDPTEGRSLSIAKHADGSITGRFDLDAVGGEKVQAALESLVQANRPAGDHPHPRPAAGRRPGAAGRQRPRRRATCRSCAPSSRTWSSPSASTTSPTRTPAPAPRRTGFGARISAARARWLACDGTISRIIIGPDGQPLDLGRSQRIVPPHLRKSPRGPRPGLRLRRLLTPRPTGATPTMSSNGSSHDGPTSIENAALLCERHHTKVHHGFRIERQPDGRWRTWRPDGTEILRSCSAPRRCGAFPATDGLR